MANGLYTMDDLAERVTAGAIVATDYDGCLSPLHDNAEEAWRARRILEPLQRLGASRDHLVVAISGRPRRLTPDGKRGIEDFLRTENVYERDPRTGANVRDTELPVARFPGKDLGYELNGSPGRIHVIANHGTDMDPALVTIEEDQARAAELFAPMSEEDAAIRKGLIADLPTALRQALPDIPITFESGQPGKQIYLEVKPEGVAVHTRALGAASPADAEDALRVAREFYLARTSEQRDHPLHATAGSNVLDIMVRPASKGCPIAYLHEKFPGEPIVYIGDDITDLDAMAELRPGDIAVVVGDRLTEALRERGLPDGVDLLRLASPAEVATLLNSVATKSAARATKRGPRRSAIDRLRLNVGHVRYLLSLSSRLTELAWPIDHITGTLRWSESRLARSSPPTTTAASARCTTRRRRRGARPACCRRSSCWAPARHIWWWLSAGGLGGSRRRASVASRSS
ncbi:MAG TPA: hypothetical protein VHU91_01790 [Mycobacteriales bacterium]|jgi:trehalose-6-phosphatase|nr:hypothetical protein [Mycobacteriales bacterium]